MNQEYTLAEVFGELMNDDSWESDAQMRAAVVYGLCATQIIFAYIPVLES